MDNNSNNTNGAAPQTIFVQSKSPVLGIIALVLGLIGIFILSFILSPIALILGTIALFRSKNNTGNLIMGILGIIFAIIGILTSPILMMMFGTGALISFI